MVGSLGSQIFSLALSRRPFFLLCARWSGSVDSLLHHADLEPFFSPSDEDFGPLNFSSLEPRRIPVGYPSFVIVQTADDFSHPLAADVVLLLTSFFLPYESRAVRAPFSSLCERLLSSPLSSDREFCPFDSLA